MWVESIHLYKNKNLRKVVYREICNSLKKDFEELKEKRKITL